MQHIYKSISSSSCLRQLFFCVCIFFYCRQALGLLRAEETQLVARSPIATAPAVALVQFDSVSNLRELSSFLKFYELLRGFSSFPLAFQLPKPSRPAPVPVPTRPVWLNHPLSTFMHVSKRLKSCRNMQFSVCFLIFHDKFWRSASPMCPCCCCCCCCRQEQHQLKC